MQKTDHPAVSQPCMVFGGYCVVSLTRIVEYFVEAHSGGVIISNREPPNIRLAMEDATRE